MEIHFVKWSSATVSKRLLQRTFEVRALLTGGQASDLWGDEFERVAQRRAEEIHHDLWISANVSFERDAIVIEVPAEGREDDVFEAFDEIVVAANTATAQARERAARREVEEKDGTEPRNAAARKMQDRLRSRATD